MKIRFTIRRLMLIMAFIAMILAFRTYRIRQFQAFEQYLIDGEIHNANALVWRTQYRLPDEPSQLTTCHYQANRSVLWVDDALRVKWLESQTGVNYMPLSIS